MEPQATPSIDVPAPRGPALHWSERPHAVALAGMLALAVAMGGLIFCGPGVGIVLTGLAASAMVAAQWRAASGWVVFGVLSVLLCVGVWPVVRGRAVKADAGAQPRAAAQGGNAGTLAARGVHAVAYGLAGLGYIVTATFLPVIARAALPSGSPWPDLFWPMFGAGVAVGAALSTRAPSAWDRRWLLLAAYALQALGIVLGLVWPTPAGFALSSALVGLPFTAITFYGLQEARRLWPQSADSFASLVTAVYGLGQIAGPPLVAWLLAHADAGQGFARGLALAAGALVAGAAMYGWSAWRWPQRA